MVEFTFYLSEDYYDKLYDLKDELLGRNLTGNEAAKKFLEQYIDILSYEHKDKR